jgi:hypothetical protein
MHLSLVPKSQTMRIISVDRLDNGAVVSFDDGRSALYPAALLYATLRQAQAMPSVDEDSGLPYNKDGLHGGQHRSEPSVSDNV